MKRTLRTLSWIILASGFSACASRENLKERLSRDPKTSLSYNTFNSVTPFTMGGSR